MAKRIIECSVTGEYINGAGVVIGAAGSHDDVTLQIEFDNSWNGLNLWATFRDAIGENPCGVPISANDLAEGKYNIYNVSIPETVLRYSGKIKLILTGYSVSGVYDDNGKLVRVAETQERHTTAAYFRVLPSDVAMYDDGSIDGTIAQELLEQINANAERINDLDGIYATDEALAEGVASAKGMSSSVGISPNNWRAEGGQFVVSPEFNVLGENDVIFFAPLTDDDRRAIIDFDIQVDPVPVQNEITFRAAVKPDKNIGLYYFISRGA
jgi:hypothetical protein